ncbi:MAG: hypothetical protein RJB38_372 [Pseudomonadota bacterium]|jgi:serine/threonine protein phosphatase PrpC
MKISANALSHQGLVRKNNEDFQITDVDLGIFIVCDGVGGHASGQVASALAARTIHETLSKNRPAIERARANPSRQTREELTLLLEKAVLAASSAVYQKSLAEPEHRGMATTAEILLLAGSYAILGHVGDSRAYLLRRGAVTCLTNDHTVASEMVRNGTWTPEEAAKSKYSSTLTRSVGHQEFVQVDSLTVELTTGDTMLLCSDGLSNYFQKGTELGEVARRTDFQKLSQALIDFALSRGGGDNATALVLRVDSLKTIEPDSEKTRPIHPHGLDAIQKIEIVKKVPIFQYFDPRELNRFLSLAHEETLPASTALLKEGEVGNQFFVILSGSVSITKSSQEIAIRSQGACIGEMAIIDNQPRSASATTREPTSVLRFSQKEVFDLMRKDAQIAVKFLWALSQAVNRSLREASDQLATLKAEGRPSIESFPFLLESPTI